MYKPSTITHQSNAMKATSGVYMYLCDWQAGPYSFFPTPGHRRADGGCYKEGGCGNYHNATATDRHRTNAMHIHGFCVENSPFDRNAFYVVKSLAGSIRCVRDTK